MEFAGRLDLEERLLRLWANPETYQTACSLRLATTTAELFTHFRRVAETDDLIFSSLFAFIAGNLSVYAERQIALQLETLSRRYLGRTFRLLKDYMDQAFPAGIPRLGTILPMQYACFLLASYGMADDPSARAIEIGHNTKVFKQAMIQANDEVFPASSQNDELEYGRNTDFVLSTLGKRALLEAR
ncbi:uncharacterized protein BJX67DRAFT_381247 [Aspergillus lucknowensis]|uniref:Uncharacterized protein n=1 Tax=Aspergillus lucknowensis TaxID=176173 RepID=A0ABR4LRT0_9EURO